MGCVQVDNVQFKITYGDGSYVQGYTDFDVMTLGTPPVTIQNQGFGEMYYVSREFLYSSCDGLYVSALAQNPSSM